jgi:Flp pilus assembly protein TadG
MKAIARTTRRRRNGQSLVEFALGGLLLMMFLAAAVDFGRAYYIYIVTENMAGEAALIAGAQPDYDYTDWSPTPPSPHNLNETYQMRARNVAARVMGGIISPANVDPTNDVQLISQLDGSTLAASERISGCPFVATVGYHVDDLFFPGILGFRSLTLGGRAPGTFAKSSAAVSNPPPSSCP